VKHSGITVFSFKCCECVVYYIILLEVVGNCHIFVKLPVGKSSWPTPD